MHSVLFLILAFFNAAGLFVLMGAEFLAMILVVVYVGAVAVLFLFVVMMLDINFAELRQGFLQYLPIGALIGIVLLVELVFVLGSWARRAGRAPGVLARRSPALAAGHQHRRRSASCSTPSYVYLFQAAGMILLVAMIGAIVLTLRQRDGRAPPEDRRARSRAAAPKRSRSQGRADRGGASDMLQIGLAHYLTVAAILFTLGIFGIFLNRKNVIIILMSIELMLLAVNINLVAFSAHLDDLVGQVFAMFVLTVAAAEAAIGLAILVVYFRNRGSIAVEDINLMKG